MARPTTLVKSLAAASALLAACSGSNTTRPKTANAPAAQLAKGEGYRRVYPTFVTQSVIAASEFSTEGNAKLEYLVKAAEPIELTKKGEPMGVKVAPAEPASALFIDDPSRDFAIGTLKFVDLAAKPVAVKSVKDGTLVPSDGVFYGADGHQILFVSGFNATKLTGKLEWTDTGANVRAVATEVSPTSLQFSTNRDVAVAIAELDETGTTGTLYAIAPKSGDKTKLAERVKLFGYQRDLAYSLSADGTQVVYTTADDQLLRISTRGGEPTKVSPKGASPAISPDGQTVVFFAEDKLFTWSNGTATFLADSPNSVRPMFSPDQNWVIYFGAMTFSGQGAGAVGDAYLVPSTGNSTPVKVASNVGWDAVKFNSKSSRVLAVGDLTSLDGQPSYEGIGNLFVSQPGQALQKVAVGTKPGNAATLEQSDSLAYIAQMEPGSATAQAFLASPDGTQPQKLQDNVVPGTLQVPKGFDSLVFIGDAEDDLLDGIYRVGGLYGVNAKREVAKIKNAESGVIQVVFGRDGRPVVVVAKGDNAGIWTLPAP